MLKKILLSFNLFVVALPLSAGKLLDLKKQYPNLSIPTLRVFVDSHKKKGLENIYRDLFANQNAPLYLRPNLVHEAIATTPEYVNQLQISFEKYTTEIDRKKIFDSGDGQIFEFKGGENPSSMCDFLLVYEYENALKEALEGMFPEQEQLDKDLQSPLRLYEVFNEFLKSLEIKQNTSNGLERIANYEKVTSFFKMDLASLTPRGVLLCSEARAVDEGQRILYLKRIYPFLCFASGLLPEAAQFIAPLRERLIKCERKYALFQIYARTILGAYDEYQTLEKDADGVVLDSEKKGFAEFYAHSLKERNERVEKLEEQIKAEYAEIENDVMTGLGLAKESKSTPQRKQQKKKNQKADKRGKQIAAAIAFERQQREAEDAARIEQKEALAKQRAATRAQTKFSDFATNEGAYHHWYWASQTARNAKKEVCQLAQEKLATQEARKAAKASKSHDIDEDKAAASTASTATTKSMPIDGAVSATPEQQDVITLTRHHQDLFNDLFDDEQKDAGLQLDAVGRLFVSLGGYIDPHRSGSRQALAIRHRETGGLHLRVIHYHAKNGRKALRPEQVLDIRDMLIEAGYSPEMIGTCNTRSDEE